MTVSPINYILTTDATSEVITLAEIKTFLKDNKVELLLESVERSNEIDVKRASGALERASQRRKNTKEPIDNMRLEASLLRAVNRLRVSKK